MYVARMKVAHEERELGEAHQVEVGLDMAVEVLGERGQRGDQVHPGGPLLNCEQELLLAHRSAEVTQEVAVPGTHVLQRVPAVEVLRASREIHPLGPVSAVAEIIGIVVVEHRMQQVEVNTPYAVDDPDQPAEADPGGVMD